MEPMHYEDILDNLSKLKGWSDLNQDFITKTFRFLDFKEALNFVNKIGVISEAQNHHPKIIISYNEVILQLSTHEAQGITLKDFDLAFLIDEIFEDNKKNSKRK